MRRTVQGSRENQGVSGMGNEYAPVAMIFFAQRKLRRFVTRAVAVCAFAGCAVDLVAATSLAFTSVSVSNGEVHLTFTSEVGVSYQVQKTSDPGFAAWFPIMGPIVATGSSTTVTDSSAFDQRAFFRVINESGPGSVYSLNMAAYANVSVTDSSWNLIANPFLGNTTLQQLFSSVSPSSQILKVGVAGFECSFYEDFDGWLDCTTFNPASTTLSPGEGAFLYTDQPFTQTFVGIVPESSLTNKLTNKLPAGLSLCSSIVPQAGLLKSELFFPISDRDTIYKFNQPLQTYDAFSYFGDDVWDPQEPVIGISEAFWADLGAATDWVRNFTVGGGGFYVVTNKAYSGGPHFLLPTGGAGTAPSITTQPQSRTNLLGSDATFTVTADGTLPLSYQWRFNGVSLPGATGSTYTHVNVQGTNAGSYTVSISNPYGAVSSEIATLTVPAVFLDAQPVVNTGFAVDSTQVQIQSGFAGGAIFYTLDGTYPGRGNLYFAPFTLSTSAVVRVLAYSANYSRAAESTPVNLTVFHTPAISAQPQNQNALVGGSASFSVSAAGDSPLNYGWYFNGAFVPGSSSSTFSIADVQPFHAGAYHVQIGNPYGSTTSLVATLNVFAPVGITSHPASTNVDLNAAITFSINASGTPPLQYQWRLNGANLAGKTNDTLTIPRVKLTDGGTYTAVVVNEFGSLISNPAQLIVRAPTLQPGDQFDSHVVLPGSTGSVSGSNTFASRQVGEPNHAGKPGGKSVWYKWQPALSGVATIHTRGSSFDTLLAVYQGSSLDTLIKVAEDDDGGGNLTSEVRFNATSGVEYSIVLDGVGAASGYLICNWTNELAAQTVPVILAQPQDMAVQPGSNALFSVTASGSMLTYQWLRNGIAIFGATNPSLALANVQLSAVAFYNVRITNSANQSALSSAANLELTTQPAPPTRDKFADVSIDGSAPLLALPGKAAAVSAAFTTVSFGLPGSRDFVNTTSSSDLRDPSLCAIGGASRWIVLAPTNAGRLSLDTMGTAPTLPTILAVYRGGTFADLVETKRIACDINSAPDGHSLVRFDVQAGSAYSVLVDGTNGVTGQIHLNYCLGSSPIVTAQATSITTVLEGNTLMLAGSVSAALPPPIYQWYHDGIAISGETNPTYNLANISPAASGVYSLVASNCLGIFSNVITRVAVNLPLLLSFSALRPSGYVDLNVSGGTGRAFMIQSTTNFLNWIPLYTNSTPFAWINFVHPSSAPHTNRFYRAMHWGP